MSDFHRKKNESANEGSKKPRQPKKLPKYLNEDEIELLLNTPYKFTNLHHILMMKLGVICGLRGSEVIKLKKEDIDLERLQIHVEEGKYSKDRIVTIPPSSTEFIKDLTKYLENINDSKQKVFGITTTSALTQMVKRYAKHAGIKRNVNFHMLRHSHAVHSIRSGVNLRSVQKNLGHSSLSTTAIYLDVMAEDVKKDYRNHPLPFL